jgi:hypothetical protein
MMSLLKKLRGIGEQLLSKSSAKKEAIMFDENKLISLKQNFTNQQFQWIKTDRPELVAKVVKCRDVQPTPDGRFTVFFDDGSKVDSTKLNSNLLMIHGEVQPLTRAEVEAIYPTAKPKTPPLAAIPQASPKEREQPVPTQPHVEPVVPQARVESKPNMFVMFNSEPTNISIDLDVRLPDKKLLKMMYSGAEDKDKFVSELADYLLTQINKAAVVESINKMLVVPPKKKPAPGVSLTQVQ